MATEKQLIDANTLIKQLWAHNAMEPGLTAEIEHCPTVDAVEVVRCKNCSYYEEKCLGCGYCYHWDYEQGMSPNQVEPDDFCSYGERKGNG